MVLITILALRTSRYSVQTLAHSLLWMKMAGGLDGGCTPSVSQAQFAGAHDIFYFNIELDSLLRAAAPSLA